MKFRKSLLSVLTALSVSAMLLTGCATGGAGGYLKNKVNVGNAVYQFDKAVQNANYEWLGEFLEEYPGYDINYCGNTIFRKGIFQHETINLLCIYSNTTSYRRDQFLEYMLDKGVDPDIRLYEGKRILERMCSDYNYHPRMVDILLDHGANPNCISTERYGVGFDGIAKIENIYTPIFWSIYTPAYNNAEHLLECGAKITYAMLDDIHWSMSNIKGSAIPFRKAFEKYIADGGESPFVKAEEYAILGDSENLIKELENGERLTDQQAEVVRYFIYRFCTPEALEIVKEKYPDINDNDKKYNTGDLKMCEDAALDGNYEMVKYFIDSGMEISTTEYEFGNEILLNAVKGGHIDVCRLLLDNGYEIKPYDKSNDVPRILSAAYETESREMFELVTEYLHADGNINEMTISEALGGSEFRWSDYNKYVIDYLMDNYGLTFQCFGACSSDYETAKYLFDKGKPLSVRDLPDAITTGDPQIVELVLDMGADPNQRMCGNDRLEEYLVPYDEYRAKHETDDSSTLYYSICKYGNSEIAQLMIDRGMDVNDSEILFDAIVQGSYATFMAFYNAGAPVDYKSPLGDRNLINEAEDMGRDNIVKVLKKAGVKKLR